MPARWGLIAVVLAFSLASPARAEQWIEFTGIDWLYYDRDSAQYDYTDDIVVVNVYEALEDGDSDQYWVALSCAREVYWFEKSDGTWGEEQAIVDDFDPAWDLGYELCPIKTELPAYDF